MKNLLDIKCQIVYVVKRFLKAFRLYKIRPKGEKERVMSSIFDGMGSAQIGQGGVYFLPGKYLVEVKEVKMVETRKREDLFIAECLVKESDNPDLRPGMCASYCCNRKHDSFLGNVKAFLAACAGVDPKNAVAVKEAFTDNGRDTSSEVAELAVSKENPFAGTLLNLTCVNKKTKSGNDFTLHFWEPRV